LCWDIAELIEEYKRLRGHPGCPGGAFDAVFLQDKILYLLALDEKDHLPTLRIDMPIVSETGELLIKLSDQIALETFIDNTKSENGWVVKTPFTTCGSVYKGNIFCSTFAKVISRITRIAKISNFIPRACSTSATRAISLPYIMIQPRIISKECKVLVINGKAKLVTNSASGFKSNGTDDVFLFAEKVTKRLKEVYPATMIDYIVRVDIFEYEGELKLNEFESFDADFLLLKSGTKRKRTGEDHEK